MIRWLPLVFANLRRRPLRVFFTVGSVMVAFTMFALLEALRTGFATSVNMAGVDRLMTLSKVSIVQPLPFSYVERVKAVPGVSEVVPFNWFGGVFRDGRTQIPVYACDPAATVRAFPELRLTPAERDAWLSDRQGVIVGPAVAERYGIRPGDRIPLRSAIYRKRDGSDVWEMNVVAIYDVVGGGLDKASLFFHRDYFNESLRFGRNQINWMVLRISDPARSIEIGRAVDALFANSSFETKTATERAMTRQFADQVGNISAILVSVATAVFFTMLLVTANTMAQSVRERTSELGVLKTLGFRNEDVMTLVLLESLIITAVGAVLGFALGWVAVDAIGEAIRQFVPVFEITPLMVVQGATLALLLGVVAGLWPATQALRLRITEALRRA